MIADLPAGWAALRLGDICELNPRSKPDLAPTDMVSFVPMIAVDERSGSIVRAATRPYSEVKTGYNPFQEGDVLFAKISPSMENGKAAIARNLTNGVGFGSTEFHVLRPSRIVLAEWIYFLVRMRAFRNNAAGSCQGAVGQQRVPEAFLAGFLVPVPSLSEQHRIVSILLEAQFVIDLQSLADEKSAALVSALYGDNPISSSQASGGVRAATLGDICDVQGGVQVSKRRSNLPVKVPYLRVANVQRNRIILDDVLQIRVTEPELERTALRKGDILVVEGHGNFQEVGRAAVWTGEIAPCTHQNHLIRLRCKDGVSAQVVCAFLNSPAGRNYFLAAANTTSGLNTISTRVLSDIPVPRWNHALASKFEKLIAEFEAFGQLSRDTDGLKGRLIQALSFSGYSGKLTAKWRERRQEDLSAEAHARDEELKSAGCTWSGTKGAYAVASPLTFSPAAPKTVSGLNPEQSAILAWIARSASRVAEAEVFAGMQGAIVTGSEIATLVEGSARGNVQAVEAALSVLVAHGLVIALTRAQRDPATGEAVYGACYRFSASGAGEGEAEPGDADLLRYTEIRRILGQVSEDGSAP